MKIKGFAFLASTLIGAALVAMNVSIAQALELAQLSEGQWDEYSADNTRFDGIVWFTGSCNETKDERDKTPPEIGKLYSDLSQAAVGARYKMTAGYLYDKSYLCGQKKHHAAIDIGAPVNTAVKSVVGGKVVWVGKDAIGVDATDGNHWVYVHLKNILFTPNQIISPGQQLASVNSANHLHLEVQNGYGYKKTNGASTDLNFLIKNTISPLQAFWRLSRTGGSDTSTRIPFTAPVSSRLTITVSSVNLTISAGNLNGKTVYVQTWRPSVNGYPARYFKLRQLTATGNTITFNDLDEPGSTLAGVTYYTVASLEPITSGEAEKQRISCFTTTGGKFLCDAVRR